TKLHDPCKIQRSCNGNYLRFSKMSNFSMALQFHLLLFSQGRLACNKEGQFIIFEKEIIKVRMQFFILLAQEEQVLGPAELLGQVLGLAFMKKQVDLRMPAHKGGLRP
ncbi:hypothetical protein EFE22_08535, partial [Lactobacillus delbrueckii subsp. lactis]|nr:hypothetical protein [Lactobacillus delbrueckii subsp. lactis]MCS8615788.1 hypothetical protein [Lactobacillus delbrueckii subsp. lactis]